MSKKYVTSNRPSDLSMPGSIKRNMKAGPPRAFGVKPRTTKNIKGIGPCAIIKSDVKAVTKLSSETHYEWSGPSNTIDSKNDTRTTVAAGSIKLSYIIRQAERLDMTIGEYCELRGITPEMIAH